jgi:uncharacterized protein HemY
MFGELGRALMVLGALLFLIGVVLTLAGRLPGFGQLPGDVVIKRDNFQLFAPLGTMLVLSLILTLVVNLLGRFFR